MHNKYTTYYILRKVEWYDLMPFSDNPEWLFYLWMFDGAVCAEKYLLCVNGSDSANYNRLGNGQVAEHPKQQKKKSHKNGDQLVK